MRVAGEVIEFFGRPGRDEAAALLSDFRGAPIGYWHDTAAVHMEEALGLGEALLVLVVVLGDLGVGDLVLALRHLLAHHSLDPQSERLCGDAHRQGTECKQEGMGLYPHLEIARPI